MEETIDLRECISIIKKRYWIILLITTIALSISIIMSIHHIQLYQASTTLIVNVEKSENQPMFTSDQISAGQKLALLYSEIIKSRAVLQPVIEQLKIDISLEQLASMISISQVKDTNIMNLSVTDTDPDRATEIANTIPTVFTEEVKRTIKANGVEVLDKALAEYALVQSQNNLVKIGVAGILGIMSSIFIIFIIEFFDNKIKNPQDIEKHLNIPILGIIPNENNF